MCWLGSFGSPNTASARAAEVFGENHDAVVLEESLDIEIRSSEQARVRYLKRCKVNTPRGADDHKDASVFYSIPSVTIVKLEGTVTPPKGKAITTGKAHVVDGAAFAAYELYSDSRHRTLNLPGVVPGATVEHTYEMDVRSLQYLPGEFWFQDDEPARTRTLTVRAPLGFSIRFGAVGDMVRVEHSKRAEGSSVINSWVARDMPAFSLDSSSPPATDLVAKITIEPSTIVWGGHRLDASTWDGIARFYLDLARERMKASPEVAEAARRLTQETASEDSIRRVYEFVQRKVNYVAIELGIGGYQPHHNRDVLQHMYGDCKDKATLMIAMLDSLGIEVLPVLIRTRNAGLLDPGLPALSFNHAIVAVPAGDGYLFADPTSESTPFGAIPWWDQDASALVVTREGKGRFLRTPLSPPEDNRRDVTVSAGIDTSGNLHGTLTVSVRGVPREELARIADLKEMDRDEEIHDLLRDLIPGAEFASFSIGPVDETGAMELKAPMVYKGYVTRAGPVDILAPHLVRWPQIDRLASTDTRRQPVFFRNLSVDSSTLRLRLPPSRTVRTIPEPQMIEGPGVNAGTRFSLEELPRQLVVESTVTVSKREIPAADYPRLRAVLDHMTRQRTQAITLRSP